MNNVPDTLKYSKTHEWVREDSDDILTIGITDYAQCMLGDIVYVELPDIDSVLEEGEECAVVESVKATADVYFPVMGEIIEVNEELLDNPHLINEDPYGQGWLVRVHFDNREALDNLLDAQAYSKQVASEAH